MTKESNIQEKQLISMIADNILVTKYNWSLGFMTLVIWRLFFVPYYNTNYHLPSTIFNYLIFLSGASFLAFYLKTGSNKPSQSLIKAYSSLVFLCSIITLMMLGSLGFNEIASFTLLPLDIFTFLLLIKNIYLETSGIKRE